MISRNLLPRQSWFLVGLALSEGACAHAPQPESPVAHAHRDDDEPTSHRRFDNPTQWARVFEDPARDGWQHPDAVLRHLELGPNDAVADIGSATGYFAVRIARAIPQGRVLGIEIEPAMVDYLNDRAQSEGLPNLESRLGRSDDPLLPYPVNVIFLCDTYHHIGDRRAYFRRLIPRLRPDGRLAIVDWKPGALGEGPENTHRLAAEQVIAEMDAAGWLLARRDDSLPYQYLLIFVPKPSRTSVHP